MSRVSTAQEVCRLARAATLLTFIMLMLGRPVHVHAQRTTSVGVPRTAPAPVATPPQSTRVTLSVSGGISLGSWQAGATWATIELLKNRAASAADTAKRPPVLAAVTGASAGNINALIAAVEWCTAPAGARPDQSLFWKTWIPIGWSQLLSNDTTMQGEGVLSRSNFLRAWTDIQERVRDYNRGNVGRTETVCQIPIGITATKVTPVSIGVSTDKTLKAQVQRTLGVVQLLRRPRLFDSLVFAGPDSAQISRPSLGRAMMLPADGTVPDRVWAPVDQRVRVREAELLNLVIASAAFPVAFGPVRLSLYPGSCAANPPRVDCTPEPLSLYADGGVFDNQAISAALGLADATSEATLERLRTSLRDIGTTGAACTETQQLLNDLVAIDTAQRALERSRASVDSIFTVTGVPDTIALFKVTRQLSDLSQRRAEQWNKVSESNERGACAAVDAALNLLKSPSRTRTSAMFIDAGVLRGPMLEWQHPTRVTEHRRGSPIKNALELVRNAVGPATQYELAMLGRGVSSASDVTVMSTSRALPLMADNYAHFGAFVSTVFRQYDFYVGVYDGIRHYASTFACEKAPAACVDSVMLGLIGGTVLNLGCDARRELATLFALESGSPEGDRVPWDPSVVSCLSDHPPPMDRDVIDRGKVLAALAVAAYHTGKMKFEAPDRCDDAARSFVDGPFCDSGMEQLVGYWRRGLEVAGFDVPTRCDAREKSRVEQVTDGSDLELCRLLQHPYTHYRTSIEALVERAQRAEKGGLGFLVDAGAYAERSNRVLFHEGIRLGNPAVVHETSNGWYKWPVRVAPYTLDYINRRELDVGWRPIAVGVGIGKRRILALEPALLYGRRLRARAVPWTHAFWVGPSVSWVLPGPRLQSIGATALFGSERQSSQRVYELSGSFLAGTMRVGLRCQNDRTATCRRDAKLFVGVADVSHLLVSGTRALRGDRR